MSDETVPNMTSAIELEELKSHVRDFFGYLDYTEESDSGTVFNPVHIGCCRAMMMDKVEATLKAMKELSVATG